MSSGLGHRASPATHAEVTSGAPRACAPRRRSPAARRLASLMPDGTGCPENATGASTSTAAPPPRPRQRPRQRPAAALGAGSAALRAQRTAAVDAAGLEEAPRGRGAPLHHQLPHPARPQPCPRPAQRPPRPCAREARPAAGHARARLGAAYRRESRRRRARSLVCSGALFGRPRRMAQVPPRAEAPRGAAPLRAAAPRARAPRARRPGSSDARPSRAPAPAGGACAFSPARAAGRARRPPSAAGGGGRGAGAAPRRAACGAPGR